MTKKEKILEIILISLTVAITASFWIIMAIAKVVKKPGIEKVSSYFADNDFFLGATNINSLIPLLFAGTLFFIMFTSAICIAMRKFN